MTFPQTPILTRCMKSGILELKLSGLGPDRIMYQASLDVNARVRKFKSALKLGQVLPKEVATMVEFHSKRLQVQEVCRCDMAGVDDVIRQLEEKATAAGATVYGSHGAIQRPIVAYDRKYKKLFDTILSIMGGEGLSEEEILKRVMSL